jgi:hypothetical protein
MVSILLGATWPAQDHADDDQPGQSEEPRQWQEESQFGREQAVAGAANQESRSAVPVTDSAFCPTRLRRAWPGAGRFDQLVIA